MPFIAEPCLQFSVILFHTHTCRQNTHTVTSVALEQAEVLLAGAIPAEMTPGLGAVLVPFSAAGTEPLTGALDFPASAS